MKLKLLVLSLLISTVSWAQVSWQSELEMETPVEFNYAGNLIYTWHYNAGTYYKYTLTLYNNSFQELNQIMVENKKTMKLKAAAAMGDAVFFYALGGKEATIIKVDGKGQKVKELSFEDSESDIRALFFQTDGSKLYIGRSIKPKKRGFTVECYDANLTKAWAYEKVPDKGTDRLKAMGIANGAVVLLTSFEKNAFSNPTYSSMAINANGEATGSESIEVPGSFLVMNSEVRSNGNLVVMCTYGSGPSELPDMPGGLLLYEIEGNGKLAHTYDFVFADLGDQIMPMESARPFGNVVPALHPVALLENNGEMTLMCESFYFQKVAVSAGGTDATVASKEANFFLLDLVSIKLSEGSYEVSKTSKPYQSIRFENIMVISDGAIYEQMMADRAYSYQFSHNGKAYIKGWLRNFNYYNPTDLNSEYVNVDNRVFFGRPFFGMNTPNGISGQVVRNPDFGIDHKLAYSGLMKFDSHVLVYEYRLGVMRTAKVNL